MSQSTLHVDRQSENFLYLSAQDTSIDTVRHWEEIAIADLDVYTEPQKQIYDVRALKGMSIFAVRTAVKLNAHPNSHIFYIAVLANSNVVVNLVRTILAIQPGGNIQIFDNEDDARAWLNKRVPD